MTLTFTVLPTENGIALRDLLRRRGASTALIRQVKYTGGYFCNGTPVHTDVHLAEGDVIAFALPPEPPTPVEPEETPLVIAYEDAHAMVLEKPAGQTVHPTRGYGSGTLANAFRGEVCRRGGDAPFRPVNRIDRNTSGLVLCALNAYAAPLLARHVQKRYLAVVQGAVLPREGLIDEPLALCEGSFIKRCVAQGGQPSRTQYRVLAAGEGLSLVEAVPLTGRTHQIRVHFAHLGHPLAGDDFYGGNCVRIARQALHCAEMKFVDVASFAAGKGLRFQTVHSLLPPDMAALVAAMTPLPAENDACAGE